MTVAWLHDAGPLFDVLKVKDIGLHCRFMGPANFADSLDGRLHAIVVAEKKAWPVALVTWRADTVEKVQRLQQEVSELLLSCSLASHASPVCECVLVTP